jgi:SAM-dependent methyltransferase
MGGNSVVRDRHVLYEASVQDPGADLDFFQRVYRRARGRPFHRLREDFCGTAVMACEWVRRGQDHRAWGVDLHRPTLEWSRRHHGPRLGDARERLKLVCANVLSIRRPKVDVVAALNFSYCVFKERSLLRRYCRGVRESLLPGGVFVLDVFGGTEAMSAVTERSRIASSTSWDGMRVPAFTYVWEQARFNAITHEILCRIHFELRDGTRIRRAFTYDWRLWTLPELRDILGEVGFDSVEAYLERWDDQANDTDGVFRRRSHFDNQDGWVGYLVGFS